MAYVSVSDWRPEQVTEWLKGLESCLLPYLHWFSNNEVNGQQLLNICPDELAHLGVQKIGHQELILEGVQHLRNFHYELDRENLQALALRVSCAAHSLHSEVRDQEESTSVPTHIMSDVSNAVNQVKALVSWLDRTPFSGQPEYADLKKKVLSLSLKMALSAQLDRFAQNPMSTFRDCSAELAKLADSIIQEGTDPMILQPAYLDLATLKKRVGEDLGFLLVPNFHGEHQIGEMKLSSPAHQAGKIQPGDEIVQINYQTVVGWERKKVLALIEESPNDLLLTLKRRPRHVYGQMYMKPYRLPSRKRASPYTRWNENQPSPRPEFLTIPHFDIPSRTVAETKQSVLEESVTSSSSDEEFPPEITSSSPTSARLYLPKPRAPIQRRYTLSGPPRPSVNTEQFWRELQLERSWRSNQNNSQTDEQKYCGGSGVPLREKSASIDTSVACDKPTENATVNDTRSIIELNKVKRDAFFSNMGCPPKPTAPRGRLDKSRSTPAYDLGEPEVRDAQQAPQPSPRNAVLIKLRNVSQTVKPWELDEGTAYDTDSRTIPNFDSISDLIFEHPAIIKEASISEPEHGQMVNTINQTLRTDPDEDAFFAEEPPAPREIRPVPAQRKMVLPPAPPPKPKLRPLPPEPPPRPEHHSPAHSTSPPSPSTSTQSAEGKERTKNTLGHFKAMWTLGKNNSPRSTRKQNPALTRRRQVTVKDLSPCEVSGVLWQRRGSATWRQGFFMLQGPAFYGFRYKERPRADLFIFLPGFTCSIADEVKSKNHAFKIYHTGTVFYFAAESEEELQQWLDGATMATTSLEEGHQGDTSGWSETDSDSSDTEHPPDSCFPTGSRVSRLLGVPARSHQNLSTESVKCDSPRKFSSLKKMSTSKPAPNNEANHAASLDRKFRFLGPKNVPKPVPTSQFRSYRRMQPVAAPPRPPINREGRGEISQPPVIHLNSPEGVQSLMTGMDGNTAPRLTRRTLHSSNPSLVNPEMADYRMTQERLREFRNLRSQGRPVDLTGFMTLEQFMLSRQEEERNLRSGRPSRMRVYPSQTREASLDTSRRDSQVASSNEKPQVAPRTNLPPSKVKHQSPAPPPSPSTSFEGAESLRTQALPDYPGIEYPPAFEPETYTLQYMIKNRRKKDHMRK